MNTKDTKLIFEAYLTEIEERPPARFGPPVAPSIDPNALIRPKEWEVQSVYKAVDWDMKTSHPYNQYVSTALSNLSDQIDPLHTYIVFFSLKQDAISHGVIPDPAVVIAVEVDLMQYSVDIWSEPILVRSVASKNSEAIEFEDHTVSDELATSLIFKV